MLKNILSKRELLPTKVMYIPIAIYSLYLIIKYKNFGFFTNINNFAGDTIEIDKYTLGKKLPKELYPESTYINLDQPVDAQISIDAIKYPIICKPINGCRGNGVKKIHNKTQLQEYHTKISKEFIIQSFITYPMEFGIYYIKKPSQPTGKIVGIVYKDFPKVIGDGVSTLEQLIEQGARTKIFKKNFYERNKDMWHQIIEKGKTIEITDLGNHAQGSRCKDVSFLNSTKLETFFDEIGAMLGGIHFGRYDIKCTSFEDLTLANNIMIIELNGVIAEPLHLYDTDIYTPREAYKIRYSYVFQMMQISLEQNLLGKKTKSILESIKTFNTLLKNL